MSKRVWLILTIASAIVVGISVFAGFFLLDFGIDEPFFAYLAGVGLFVFAGAIVQLIASFLSPIRRK